MVQQKCFNRQNCVPSVFVLTDLFALLLRSVLECEKLVKATYRRNGLVYPESSSDDEGGGGGVLSGEVIEIDDDDDDDVIAVGCCKLRTFLVTINVIQCFYDNKITTMFTPLLFL